MSADVPWVQVVQRKRHPPVEIAIDIELESLTRQVRRLERYELAIQTLTAAKISHLGLIAAARHGTPASIARARCIEKQQRASFAFTLTYPLTRFATEQDYSVTRNADEEASRLS